MKPSSLWIGPVHSSPSGGILKTKRIMRLIRRKRNLITYHPTFYLQRFGNPLQIFFRFSSSVISQQLKKASLPRRFVFFLFHQLSSWSQCNTNLNGEWDSWLEEDPGVQSSAANDTHLHSLPPPLHANHLVYSFFLSEFDTVRGLLGDLLRSHEWPIPAFSGKRKYDMNRFYSRQSSVTS